MAQLPGQFEFYKWNREQMEKGLEAMGCKNPSVGALPLLNKAALLYSDEKFAHPTSKECLKSLQSTKYQLFNDPIHGSIELHPLLAKIVKMPVFTRLKNIRQLGGVYYVYPGATHTRFEHSIGTCYIAGEFIRMLQRKQPELHISDKEALCVEIAALCHDLGHGPFSHLFEKDVVKPLKKDPELPLLKDFPKHEKLSTMVFEYHVYLKEKDLFNGYGVGDRELGLIKELIDHDLSASGITKLQKPERRFLYEIVANKCTGIDVDKWDYFARDCHYMGILTEFDWRRLMALSRVIKVNEEYRICYRDKEVNNIYGMFRTRCSLHQKAYQHKSVIAAERMIALAILKVKNLQLIIPWNADDKKTLGSRSLTAADVGAKEKDVDAKEKDVGAKEKDVGAKETDVGAKKKGVDAKEKDVGAKEKDVGAKEKESKCTPVSVVSALREVTKSPPKLEGYLALNDSIVHLILNCPVERSVDKDALQEAQTLLRQLDQREMFQLITSESEVSELSVSEQEILKYDAAKNPDDKLKSDDLYIRPVQISYASEKNKNGEMDDPVKETHFYTKEKPWEPVKGDLVKKSDLVCPKAFVSNETRLYCSPGATKRKRVSEAYYNYDQAKKQKMTDSAQPATMTPTRSGNDQAEETPSDKNKATEGGQAKRKLNYPK